MEWDGIEMVERDLDLIWCGVVWCGSVRILR